MNEKSGVEIIFKRCEHTSYILGRTISIIATSAITNRHSFIMLIPVNKYLLHYSLFLKFSQVLYINWITGFTECGTIYKNISKLKKKHKM